MTLGWAERQGDLLDDVVRFCDGVLPERSIYGFLHRERDNLFPDEFFADLYSERGRPSVPPSVVAVVMSLQRLECLSDREAVERFAFDARWRYAAGVGGYDGGGWWTFSHSVLVEMRERLRKSKRPDRVFDASLNTAAAAGMVGRKRVLDSTPLYDAVATMDTITLIRSAMRGLLSAAGKELEQELRALCTSGDDYANSSKPQIDWDDKEAREQLIDSRARDARAVLAALDDRELDPVLNQAAELLARVSGQDLEETEDGRFRIARRVARDRVISTVDPQARHGHKTSARGFDGYKGHIAMDPDSEIVTATAVTPGNAGDATVVEELLTDILPTESSEPVAMGTADHPEAPATSGEAAFEAFGDSAYGTGKVVDRLERAGVVNLMKVQPPHAPAGRFSKDNFIIDLDAATVTCPNDITAGLQLQKHGIRLARFGDACTACPLRSQCTDSPSGRSINVGPYEAPLARAREQQRDPGWKQRYRASRPKVERKQAHMMRRKHGGRRARVRGEERVGQDFAWLGAVQNLLRMANREVRSTLRGQWIRGAV